MELVYKRSIIYETITVIALQNTELDFLAVLPSPHSLHSLVRHAYPPYLTGF